MSKKSKPLPARLNRPFPYQVDPESIPTCVLFDPDTLPGDSPIKYACPDDCWREHLDAWCKIRRDGNKQAPVPMPYEHCMFENPRAYGMVPYGCADQSMIRDAIEVSVRANLDGWDRDMKPEQLDRIVKATVDAKMNGVEVGALPYIACITATL